MKLRYRGISYQPQEALVEIIPSNIAARFLGKTYVVRRPVNSFSPRLGLRQYRGIAYGD
ncbi:DUF4278 domain-containing protein [Pleurocapsales cyanobacterium LEGE 06147]|nr:DUF4278 domain-containing protein [Pleurocapsales cyanobacterium LEGE 06147]